MTSPINAARQALPFTQNVIRRHGLTVSGARPRIAVPCDGAWCECRAKAGTDCDRCGHPHAETWTAHLLRVGPVVYVVLDREAHVLSFATPGRALRALGLTPTPTPEPLTRRGALTIAQALDGVHEDPQASSPLAREVGGAWDSDDAVYVFPDASTGGYQNIHRGAFYPNTMWFEAYEDEEESSE